MLHLLAALRTRSDGEANASPCPGTEPSIAAAPKPRVLAITGRKEDGDVPVEMGKFGKEFMGGEDRYSRIAVKYVSL